MENKKYLFVTHRTYDKGRAKLAGIDQIISCLDASRIFLIEHPFESDYYYSFLKYKFNSDYQELKKIVLWPRVAPWRWLTEIFCNCLWVSQLKKTENITIIFAVDALNAFSFVLLKLFIRDLKIYFFSADYSDRRFKNYFFNLFYNFIYNLSLKFSDKIITVSRRTREFLESRHPRKIIFLPNSPLFNGVSKLEPSAKNKYSLVFCAGRLTERVNFEGILQALIILKNFFPDIVLNLIGKANEKVAASIQDNGLLHNVKIYDFLSHDQTVKIISESYIGISFYSSEISHVFWGDSLKIREYAAAGLPTVCDGITSTADEMAEYRAGFIVRSPEEMAEKIKKLINERFFYNETRKSALRWAEEKDKSRLVKQLIDNEQI
ncbi:MAG TPA: glycosyltransferase family 4 protein [Candidatus Methylomirabilis sp.]|nr:glycosyltransferase family 4 protein [Candidatus Methylomirabilis sp.]